MSRSERLTLFTFAVEIEPLGCQDTNALMAQTESNCSLDPFSGGGTVVIELIQ